MVSLQKTTNTTTPSFSDLNRGHNSKTVLDAQESSDARALGARISQEVQKPFLKDPKASSVFSSLNQFVKLNTSRAMWGVGFVTSGLAIISNFLIGSQVLSLIFAVPALMAFYIAHTLSKGLNKGKNLLFQDSFTLINSYINNPQLLDSENAKALKAVDELKGSLSKNLQDKDKVLDTLKRFYNIVRLKLTQIYDVGDPNSARIMLETERIVESLEPLFKDMNNEASPLKDALKTGVEP